MDIFKLLPKTNCKECKSPSCLAFAMKMAAGRASFEQCPHLSDESRIKLEELMLPPIIQFEIRRGRKTLQMGGEKVIYRHEESFYSPTAVAVEIPTGLFGDELRKKVEKIENLRFERVGQEMSVDFIALEDDGEESFADYAGDVFSKTALPLAVKTERPAIVEKILSWNENAGVLICTTVENIKNNADGFKKPGFIPAAMVETVEEAKNAGAVFKEVGIKNALFAVVSSKHFDALKILYRCRLEALAYKKREFGYPALLWDEPSEMRYYNAAAGIMKHASLVVLSDDSPDRVLPLLTLRQNIFTDPRRPIQVEAKVYEIGQVNEHSPVIITTNFSLTYFSVAQEIEAARTPSYLLIIDTDGTSVLTAWSADRFNPKTILEGIEKSGVFEKVKHREIVIPGYVAMLKEELEEASEYRVRVGPREAAGIPEYLRKLSRTPA